MAAAEQQRGKEGYSGNASPMVKRMFQMVRLRPTTVLVDEILHSIFFMGKINTPPFSPERILSDAEVINAFKIQYPRPFAHYYSKLPRRRPFSCVLDMFVNVIGRNNEVAIIQQLKDFIDTLRGDINKKPLVSKAICVSQSNPPDSDRYYGVSVSTDRTVARKILTGASCVSRIWDSYVAGAVMTFYPEPGIQEFRRKPYFDGTIRVPEGVRCQTFDLYDGSSKPPCRKCQELFSLTPGTTTEAINERVPYGNCAEAESLSNLFQRETTVREQAQPTSDTYTEGNRLQAEESVRQMLRTLVSSPNVFTRWRHGFYFPQ